MLKITFLTINIDQVGGIEKVVTNLSNYFVNKYNLDVEIISFYGKEKNITSRLDDKIKKTYLNMPYYEEKNKFSSYTNIFKYNKLVKPIVAKLDCDILITTHFLFNMLYVLNKKTVKYKAIGTEHSDYFQAGRLTRALRLLFYRKMDKFVVLTESAKQNYRNFLNNVVVINNSISFSTEQKSACTNKRIISLGRLEDEKGYLGLIDILNSVLKSNKDWEVDIFGEGSQSEEILKKIKGYNLENQIKIFGFTENVKDELLNASIFVLPSKSEAFPLVLLEAMECGVPVVSFNLSGPKEIINDNVDGILVNCKEEFIKELQRLIEDCELRKNLGSNAKLSAKKYSIDSIGVQWKLIFRELFSREVL